MRITGVTYVPRKGHALRSSISIFLVLAAILILIIVLVSFYAGWKLIHPDKSSLAAFESNLVPEFSEVSFSGSDKSLLLKGWFFKAKTPDSTIILVHDYGRNRLQFDGQTLNLLKSFVYNGYNVLAFDLRNSGVSGGKFTTFGYWEKTDILASVKFAKASGAKKITLMGFGAGASASLMAAAESPDVTAVVADSAFSDIKSYINNRSARDLRLLYTPLDITVPYTIELLTGIDIDSIDPLSSTASVNPRPVLFIHGGSDDLSPTNDSRQLYNSYLKAGGGKAGLWEAENAGHAEAYLKDQQQYIDRVLAFLSAAPEKK